MVGRHRSVPRKSRLVACSPSTGTSRPRAAAERRRTTTLTYHDGAPGGEGGAPRLVLQRGGVHQQGQQLFGYRPILATAALFVPDRRFAHRDGVDVSVVADAGL